MLVVHILNKLFITNIELLKDNIYIYHVINNQFADMRFNCLICNLFLSHSYSPKK